MTSNDPTPDESERTSKRLTAMKRRLSRYGRDAEETVSDLRQSLALFVALFVQLSRENPRASIRSGFAIYALVLTSVWFAMPAAAQNCSDGLGGFIQSVQLDIGGWILGILILALIIGAALVAIPVAGTASVGWLIIGGVMFGFVVLMVGAWGISEAAQFSFLDADSACSPYDLG